MLPLVIGHRGVVEFGYENCLFAANIARDMNVFAIEANACMTRDNRVILNQDFKIKMSNNEHVYVKDCKYSEICLQNNFQYTLLKDMLVSCKEKNVFLNVEIKCDDYDTDTPKAVCNQIRKNSNPEHIMISSLSLKALQIARYIVPDFDRMYIVEKIPPNWKNIINKYRCKGILVSIQHNTIEEIKDMKKSDFPIYAYTVNDRETFDIMISNDIGVITDFPYTLCKHR